MANGGGGWASGAGGKVTLLTHRDDVVCLEDESRSCFPLNSFKRTGLQTKGNRIQRALSVFINFQLALWPVPCLKVAVEKHEVMFNILLRTI